jgi:DNA-binding transcriptional ArsR family regulator
MSTDDEMSAIFHALAHEHRRRIMDLIKARPGLSVGHLANEFDISRIAVMNHLAVLERAGLIVSEKDGRIRRLHLNAAPIQMINDRWLDDYTGHWAQKLTGLKYAAEAATRAGPKPAAKTIRLKPDSRSISRTTRGQK